MVKKVKSKATLEEDRLLELIKELDDMVEEEASEIASALIKVLVAKSLHLGFKASGRSSDAVTANFAIQRQMIENSVSEGVMDAIKAYSGQHLDYYCQIKLCPDPKSSQVH
jgi:hypothetical protein